MPCNLAAAAVVAGVIAGTAQAARSAPTISARDLFVSICAPRLGVQMGKAADAVCGCLHDNVVSHEQDSELRLALIRGVAEMGVPAIRYAWVPRRSQKQVVETLDRLAAPTLACMFGPRR